MEINDKIADKITSIGKPKEKETKQTEEIYIPPEKRQQIINDLRLFWTQFYFLCNINFIFFALKWNLKNIVNFLDTSSDNKDLPRFATKKWIDVYDQSEKNYNWYKEIRIKTSMLRSDLCDFSDAYIVVKGTITVLRPNAAKKIKQ